MHIDLDQYGHQQEWSLKLLQDERFLNVMSMRRDIHAQQRQMSTALVSDTAPSPCITKTVNISPPRHSLLLFLKTLHAQACILSLTCL